MSKRGLQPLKTFQVVILCRVGEGYKSPRSIVTRLHKRGIRHVSNLENISSTLHAMEAKGYVRSATGGWWELTEGGQKAYDKIVARASA